MEAKKFLIVGLGEILWDVYGEKKFLGGAPANFAIHCHQLGDHGVVLSRVGKDDLGRDLIKLLQKRNIETRYLQSDESYPTGKVDVKIDERGVPHFTCHTDVAFDYLRPLEESHNLIQRADAVLFGTLAQRNDVSRAAIIDFLSHAKNPLIIYDINIRGWSHETKEIVTTSLKLANILKLNEDELVLLKRELAPNLSDSDFMNKLLEDFDLKLIALTLGEKGCLLTDGKEIVRKQGINVKVVDSTGCGDAFAAGMVHKLLRDRPLQEIAEYANYVGAYVAQHQGATPIYRKEEIDKFVSLHKS